MAQATAQALKQTAEAANGKKRFFDQKWFAVLVLLYGVFGLLLMGHFIGSYENLMRPEMDYLISHDIVTNDVSGLNFLSFFTHESNAFLNVYLILYALGVLGVKKLYSFTHKEALRGAITLYIGITGIIYCAVLMPFAPSFFPFSGCQSAGLRFANVVNTWNHMLSPLLFVIFWFFPICDKKLPVFKTSLLYIIYPFAYYVFSFIRGAIDGFYPYPFLNGKQLLGRLHIAYTPANSVIATILSFIALLLLFLAVGSLLNVLHNKLVDKRLNKGK